MTATEFGDTETVIENRPSTNYSRQHGPLKNWIYRFGFGNPGAGLNSSISDLGRFLVALQRDEIVSRTSKETLWAKTVMNDGSEFGYGLAWTVDDHRGHRVVGHEGGGAVWTAHFPDDALSVAILCNLNGARADEIQYGIADFYLEE